MPSASGSEGEGEVMECGDGDYYDHAALRLSTGEFFDFAIFFEHLATVSLLVRMQVMYQLATDEIFAVRTFRAYSAPARLRAIAAVASAESLEVS